ncbi:unnamed protein product [Callosobruchus maculatus]|uniref:Papilin n=2 Tax=Callosobruchus maculatus TaxID=64391 RepID=A0A653CS88_CALMS|nr:unnamed protein product [Callosobruchus maculatus]
MACNSNSGLPTRTCTKNHFRIWFLQRSPLALALTFIALFHNVASKHPLLASGRHHNSRHHRHLQDRFKRQQGAHLYLPGSYVTDGGDGPDQGPWEEWSAPTPCSRTCGGGVATQTRYCQPGYQCSGPTSRHFSCNTQDCPDRADFRAQQCAEFNNIPFEGVYYDWIPYTKAPDPCELNCMPRGERFYYNHARAVKDGTPCSDEVFDVCVNGTCRPVGCDMMLGSNMKEDQCRVCGGDGSTCNTFSSSIPMKDMQGGYNDILLIPAGATNIRVEETDASNNYLAIRNTSGHYYLNGNWRIDFPRTIEFAGCKFKYEREPQQFPAPDRITALGPTTEPLFVVLLYEDSDVPVDYTYSLPTHVPVPSTETYAWTYDEFTPCSATCGGGYQYRNVTCAGRTSLEPVERHLCDSNTEPEMRRRCAEVACPAQWVAQPWRRCSKPCGEGGTQQRDVTCQRIGSNGMPQLAEEAECLAEGGRKPPEEQECNKGTQCAKWHTGPWRPCDHLCGDGIKTRKVQCYIERDHKIDILDDAQCEAIEPKPEESQKCNIRPCEGVDWITSEWSGCDRICGLKNETRKVFCATASGEVHPEELCDADRKPELVRECDQQNATCEYLWYASQWSECSVTCGEGVQTRTLFCGVVTEQGVQKVENEKCDQNRHFETIRNCTGEEKECPGEWFSGPWGECSKPCGGGRRSKKVVCIKDLQVVDPSNCGSDNIVFQDEDCNTHPCSEDAILPTDVTQSVDESEPTDDKAITNEPTTFITDITKETEKTESEATKETDGTKETDTTKAMETTTQPTGKEGDKKKQKPKEKGKEKEKEKKEKETDKEEPENEEDYEIVPDTECEDGEWLDEATTDELAEQPESTTATVLEGLSTTETTAFSMDELMLSDGPTDDGKSTFEVTGSGDGEMSSPSDFTASTKSDTSTTVEGSGSDSTAIETTESSGTTSATTEMSGSTATSGTETTGTAGTTVTGGTDGTTSEATTDASTTGSDVTTEGTTVLSTTEGSTTPDTTGGTTATATTDTETPTTETVTDTTGTTSASDSTTVTELSTSETPTGTTDKFIGEYESTGSTTAGTTEIATTGTEGSTSTAGSTTEGTEGSTGTAGSTTEFTGSTETVTTGTEYTGSTTESTGSTTELTMGSTTEFTGSTTEFTGSTTEFTGSTTEFTGSTMTGTTETDIFGSSTTGSEGTESTVTDLYSTTPFMEIFTPRIRMCKRRKIMACKKTKYGCCWDKITAAKGPFNKGCPTPKTCKESKYGCCKDEVSPALGPKYAGCPKEHCNETLFGCCPDGKTTAQGNDNEGCPPKCLSTKWGCCDDKVTEAKGPKHKGCKEAEPKKKPPKDKGKKPSQKEKEAEATTTEEMSTVPSIDCNSTPYRCCPDGVTTATGPGYQGCGLPCSETPFGCCSDGNTAAHGPSGEGCCLNTAFGCCPDNIVPARGPNNDGCGCQFSPYGCCPDNKTSARGYNNEGCGCQYTEFGCCPDNFTPANGPNFEGCLCHTFQFGCCPDGVTSAKGPHQQGCGCRNSEFGCCSDEQTPATGPNMEGCGCETSKYGCCLDGMAEAKGDNFEGCETAPLNLQVGCSMPKVRGPCRNYTVKWFYDMEYGGCSRFWYGGCDGNDNRFKSKEECEEICVEPQGTDKCNLPKVAGPCEGYYPQWFYDKDSKHCSQFIYGGCLGNNNRFETREECASTCVKDDSVDACEQKKEEGPCRGEYARFYYDKESKQCVPFLYGGCKGNNNNFLTIEACKQKCMAPGRKKDHCSLPRAQGNCTDRLSRWYHDTPERRCVPFYYTGCNGNQNNFETKDACEKDCPPEVVKDTCQLPAEVGECANYVDRWYFDTRERVCRQFYYGGCGGNDNNFQTEQACRDRCTQRQPEPQRPQVPSPQQPGQPFTQDMCFSEPDRGQCDGNFHKFYYDRRDGVCKVFAYGGCGGNRNNFDTMEECLTSCGASQDICTLPPVVGQCDGEYLQYYYDPNSDSCQPFNFGGCGGNYNRFQDQASCEQRCKKTPPSVAVTPAPQIPSDMAMCYQPADPGSCNDTYVSFFYDSNTRTCSPFTYTGCGGNSNRFNSEEQCERQCGSFRGQDVCDMDRDPGPCRGYFVKYYYDKTTRQCEQFAFGGCQGNGNRFSSQEECEQICLTHEESKPNITTSDICRLSVDQGSCEGSGAYHKRWYFDDQRGECIAFIYSGCGGNFNNFKTFQSCLDFCRDLLPKTEAPAVVYHTEVAPHPCQEVFDECTTLRCPYGVEPYVDENECNRCQCRDPCSGVACREDEQCAIDINRNKTGGTDADFVAICRQRVKPGTCPSLQQRNETGVCDQECRSDADCALDLKCCSTGCGTSCVDPAPLPVPPAQLVTQQPPRPDQTYTERPQEFSPPKIDLEKFEPSVAAPIGDQAILRCAVTGNPTPKIKWSKGNILIDGTQPRYRIKLDQSLQIITLHKTDSGIYLCTAENSLGEPVTNEIKLDVLVPVRANITSADQRFPVGSDIELPCIVQGYPVPQVKWYKDGVEITNSEKMQITGVNTLFIRNVTKSDSGNYQCEATNAYSRASSTIEIIVEGGMYIHPRCTDNQYFANCALIVRAKVCTHKYYAKFCCRSCTEAGQLPVDGPHLQGLNDKRNALDTNLV